ncbi:MAG: DUF1566 domain-containing protein [Planctomycetes bacterium]|nr:DUF1566 domain-containing protein [Planctomycetota bacterium]
MRKELLIAILSLTLVIPLIVLAGNIDSPGLPDAAVSAMYTIEDIYNRLLDGTAGVKRTTPFQEPTAGPGSTMPNLDEVMSVAPSLDNNNGANPGHVVAGATYWGLTDGNWGPQTGVMPNNGAVAYTPTAGGLNVANGYHNGSSINGDANLVSGNIRTGTSIFDVAGSVIEASGAATDGQVLSGVTYSNSSGASTGTMPNNGAVAYTPTAGGLNIADGYHSGSTINGDLNLVATNIANGVGIFGVTGTLGASPAEVPKTGQTTSYDTGDDGDLERGVAWPNPRFSDNSDGTVTDNLTGLIWLKQANYNSTEGGTGSTAWANALNFCNNLQSGQCGLTDGSNAGDWRLPNIREMHSLIDFNYVAPALCNTIGTGQWTSGDPFTDVQANYYWSSTTFAASTTNAWYVYLDYGFVDDVGKGNYCCVWPVRSWQ